jgi:hypothetical protein
MSEVTPHNDEHVTWTCPHGQHVRQIAVAVCGCERPAGAGGNVTRTPLAAAVRAMNYVKNAGWTLESVRLKPEEAAAFVVERQALRAALKDACRSCSCTVRERASGHKIDCQVPAWRELLEPSL